MLWFLGVVGYILISIYTGITQEPWVYDKLGRPRYRNAEDHSGSWPIAVVLLAWTWPVLPFVKWCMNKRSKIIAANKHKYQREAEIKEAEKELDV